MSDVPNDVDASDADFESGFTADVAAPTTTPDAAHEAIQIDQPTPAPKYAQITEEQYQELLSKATAIDEVKAESKRQFDQAFGKIGGMQQLMDRLQSSTQSGEPITVSKDDFAELSAEGYPDLAELTAPALNRILAKLNLRGTGGPQPAPFDPKQIDEIVSNRIAAEREVTVREQLFDMHEDWQEVRETPEYKDWVKANNIEQRKDRTGALYSESWNPTFIGNLITEFKASKKAASTRQNRLEAAVTPRGSGGHATPSTDDDDFAAGFNS